jgi:hypothetical protein
MKSAVQATAEEKLAAIQSLTKAVLEFEKRFEVVQIYSGGPRPAHAPSGDRYVEHTFGPCPRAGDVILMWKEAVEGVAARCPIGSTLYWRVRPEIDFFNNFKPRGWGIYCRFIISPKPKET